LLVVILQLIAVRIALHFSIILYTDVLNTKFDFDFEVNDYCKIFLIYMFTCFASLLLVEWLRLLISFFLSFACVPFTTITVVCMAFAFVLILLTMDT